MTMFIYHKNTEIQKDRTVFKNSWSGLTCCGAIEIIILFTEMHLYIQHVNEHM